MFHVEHSPGKVSICGRPDIVCLDPSPRETAGIWDDAYFGMFHVEQFCSASESHFDPFRG